MSKNILNIPRSKIPLITISARFLYTLFLEPRSKHDDEVRRELILNIILSGSILLLCLLSTSVLYHSISQGQKYPGIPFRIFVLIPISLTALLVVSRRGWYVVASYILIGVYFLSISLAAFRWGVDLPIVLLGYALLITISSVLINTSFGFFITLLVGATIIPLWDLQIHGHIKPQWYWKMKTQRSDAITFFVLLMLIMVISWLSNRETERSLKRAHASEAALKQERDSLEVNVELRTHEIKQLQLERVNEMSRLAEFGRLSSGLFHDLANPLTAISLSLEHMQRTQQVPTQELKLNIEKSLHLAKRMDYFLHAIRKQFQQQEIITQFSIQDEIDQVIQILRYKAAKMNVTLSPQVPAAPLLITGDALKFYQAIENIISNAIDAYDTENKKAFRKEVLISLEQLENNICIQVTDWGSGIDPQYLSQVFDPFFTTKPPHKGTGIGLSSAKKIIEHHFNGTLNVKSILTQGSTFTIRLPINSIFHEHH